MCFVVESHDNSQPIMGFLKYCDIKIIAITRFLQTLQKFLTWELKLYSWENDFKRCTGWKTFFSYTESVTHIHLLNCSALSSTILYAFYVPVVRQDILCYGIPPSEVIYSFPDYFFLPSLQLPHWNLIYCFVVLKSYSFSSRFNAID
jgi:hypothetical protein